MGAALDHRLPAQATGATPPPGALYDVDQVVGGLRAARERWRTAQRRPRELAGRELPSPEALAELVAKLRAALFPMRLGPPDLRPDDEDTFVARTIGAACHALLAQLTLEFAYQARRHGQPGQAAPAHAPLQQAPEPSAREAAVAAARAAVRAFAHDLPRIRTLLDSDVQAAFDGDPAAGSVDEVLLCYPGVEAMVHHRLAHRLHGLGAPLLARMVAEQAHASTGIDIHPGAQIGPGFFIDHGTGVVIGETAVIGQRVRLYQHVTLGAKRFPADGEGRLTKGLPRHPVVEDDVIVYAGATILGRVTIGRGSTIGGNVWLTHSVPPGSHVTQASLQQADLPPGARPPAAGAPDRPDPAPAGLAR